MGYNLWLLYTYMTGGLNRSNLILLSHCCAFHYSLYFPASNSNLKYFSTNKVEWYSSMQCNPMESSILNSSLRGLIVSTSFTSSSDDSLSASATISGSGGATTALPSVTVDLFLVSFCLDFFALIFVLCFLPSSELGFVSFGVISVTFSIGSAFTFFF